MTDAMTPKETELLKLLADSYSNKMAHFLGISESTVANRSDSLMHKLDVHDPQGLTRAAVRLGLVDCG